MKIEYNGSYPNLCRGTLKITIEDKEWIFPNYCMHSNGSVSFDENWNECVCGGDWTIREWPEDFPEHLKEDALAKINEEIEHGCCGGCV